MLSKNPRVAQLSPDEVQAICAHYQLPRPVRVQAISKTWTHVNFGLYFDPDAGERNLMVRRVVSEPGWDTLHRELSALMVAQNTSIPVVDRYQLLPDGLIFGRAALSRLVPGTPVTALKDHAHYGQLCERIGNTLATLADLKQPHFGSSPNGAAFLPTASSWRGEWTRWASHWITWARNTGELVPGRTRLESLLEERMDALDSVTAYSLVHCDIHSGNFLADEVDGELVLSGLVDWDRAMAGDHLVDWCNLISAPTEVLAAIVRGYGADRVRAMLEPAPLARLEAYYFTHTLARIGITHSDLFRVDDGKSSAFALTVAARHVEEALEPDAVKRRLEEALGGSGPRREPKTEGSSILYRRGLSALISGPPLRADQAGDLLLALSAGALAEETEGELASRYLSLAEGVVDTLGAQTIRYHEDEVLSLEVLKTRVYEAIMSRQDPAMSLALCVLCACVTAANGLEGPPHHGTWSGLSALLESVLFLEAHRAPPAGVGRLAHGLMGFDAAITLNAPSGVQARYGAVLAEFEGVDSCEQNQALWYVDQGPPEGLPKGAKGKVLLPLILAMYRLEENNRLGVPADAVLRQLGFVK